jgi:hypothetical protein
VLSDAAPLVGTFFTTLAHNGLPAVFHCAGGKDRTGMLAAILLRWLEVDREAVLDDYELTTAYARPADRELFHGLFVTAGLTPEAAAGVLSTPRWAMAEALDTLDTRYGGAGVPPRPCWSRSGRARFAPRTAPRSQRSVNLAGISLQIDEASPAAHACVYRSFRLDQRGPGDPKG